MNETDRRRLQDMLQEGQRLQNALADKSRDDLDDYLIAYGVCHAIALIGEAAAQVSEATRQVYADIQWKDVIGMRNFIIHQYRRVDLDIVWRTATDSVGELVQILVAVLAEDDNGE